MIPPDHCMVGSDRRPNVLNKKIDDYHDDLLPVVDS